MYGIVSARHRVVHVFLAAQHLPGSAVVDDLLHQRLAETLRHAAMIWPLRPSGLTTVPTSSTTTYCTISAAPVSGSISTSQTWLPFG